MSLNNLKKHIGAAANTLYSMSYKQEKMSAYVRQHPAQAAKKTAKAIYEVGLKKTGKILADGSVGLVKGVVEPIPWAAKGFYALVSDSNNAIKQHKIDRYVRRDLLNLVQPGNKHQSAQDATPCPKVNPNMASDLHGGLMGAYANIEAVMARPPTIKVKWRQVAAHIASMIGIKVSEALLLAAGVHFIPGMPVILVHLLASHAEVAVLNHVGLVTAASRGGAGLGLLLSIHNIFAKSLQKSNLREYDQELKAYTTDLQSARRDLESLERAVQGAYRLQTVVCALGGASSNASALNERDIKAIQKGFKVTAKLKLETSQGKMQQQHPDFEVNSDQVTRQADAMLKKYSLTQQNAPQTFDGWKKALEEAATLAGTNQEKSLNAADHATGNARQIQANSGTSRLSPKNYWQKKKYRTQLNDYIRAKEHHFTEEARYYQEMVALVQATGKAFPGGSELEKQHQYLLTRMRQADKADAAAQAKDAIDTLWQQNGMAFKKVDGPEERRYNDLVTKMLLASTYHARASKQLELLQSDTTDNINAAPLQDDLDTINNRIKQDEVTRAAHQLLQAHPAFGTGTVDWAWVSMGYAAKFALAQTAEKKLTAQINKSELLIGAGKVVPYTVRSRTEKHIKKLKVEREIALLQTAQAVLDMGLGLFEGHKMPMEKNKPVQAPITLAASAANKRLGRRVKNREEYIRNAAQLQKKTVELNEATDDWQRSSDYVKPNQPFIQNAPTLIQKGAAVAWWATAVVPVAAAPYWGIMQMRKKHAANRLNRAYVNSTLA